VFTGSLRDRPVQRAVRLLAGLLVFGVSLALLIKAGLGLDPWDVFAQGFSRRTGLSIGTVTIVTSLLLLLAWIPLRQRLGIGTLANALVVGLVIDAGSRCCPTRRASQPRSRTSSSRCSAPASAAASTSAPDGVPVLATGS